jgi:ribonuclease HII
MRRCIIGIDEVGRGALAGPVVVAAVAILGSRQQSLHPARTSRADENHRYGLLKDSKKLSAKQRALWYARFLASSEIVIAVARVYPRGIERHNISGAANLAAGRAFSRLLGHTAMRGASRDIVFLDGGLYLGSRARQRRDFPEAKSIPKADETIRAVAIASIIAKVTRDRLMVRAGKKYPRYGFEVHKGYGTAVHRAALAAYGPCEIHRLTFLSKSLTINV